ncbi:MAG: hypothetical protein WC423_19670 [Vulcanimicrobiota bacterium]
MKTISLKALGALLGADPLGDPETRITGVSSLDRAAPGSLVMVESQDQVEQLQGSSIGAVLRKSGLEVDFPGFEAAEPRLLFAEILEHFHPPRSFAPGVHESASVDQRARVHPTAHVGPFCTVGPHAEIGPKVVLIAFVLIGEKTVVGEGSLLNPHVVIGPECKIGLDCRLEPWAKLGKAVELGDGVDVGAHTSLAEQVVVEAGAKLDNLVLVGPRSRIGAGSLLIGQAAVDRDAVLHKGVIVAGQGSVAPGAVLHAGVQIGGRSLAEGELKAPGPYIGTPAIPLKEEMRRRALERKKQRG